MDAARSASITELAEEAGYTLIRRGSWYSLKEAKHIIIKANNRYYDGYKHEWGDAITFLEDYQNMSFHEAVTTLLHSDGYSNKDIQSQTLQRQAIKKEKAEFMLPEANEDNRRVFSYLRKRGIAYQVIENFINAGLLYEDKQHHNCIFVGRNLEGKAVFANKRGTYDRNGVGYKGDVAGADKKIAFRLPCNPQNNSMFVFESPIDLMSYQTLHRNMTSNAVALCCLHDGALDQYLLDHPHINTIHLLLDSDEWGQNAADMPGDLIFWTKTNCHCGRWNEIHHVGIYIGNGRCIEASSGKGRVVVREIWEGSNYNLFMYARPK